MHSLLHLHCPFFPLLGIPFPPFLSTHTLLVSIPNRLNPKTTLKDVKQSLSSLIFPSWNVQDSQFASFMKRSASCFIIDSPSIHVSIYLFVIQPLTEYVLCASHSETPIPMWKREDNYNRVATATRFKTYSEGNGKS